MKINCFFSVKAKVVELLVWMNNFVLEYKYVTGLKISFTYATGL